MLITVEGIDGAGKSTVVDGMSGEFPDAVFTHEPTSSWLGENVERTLKDETTDPVSDLFLFISDHADHIERVVRPALEKGRLIFCDRYIDSRCAYQGVSLEKDDRFSDLDSIEWIRQAHRPWSIEPDLTLLLDLPVETAVGRTSGEAKYEDIEFLTDVAENFRMIAEGKDRFVIVDASQRIEEVIGDCIGEVESAISCSSSG